jgi:hypothetical protein
MAALVAGAASVVSAIFANDWLQRAWLAKKWLYRSPHGLEELGACAAVACASLVALLATWRAGRWRSTSWVPVRWILPTAAVAWMLTWRIEPPTLVFDAQLGFSGALAVWTALVALSASCTNLTHRGLLRVADIVLCELAAVLILGEIALRMVRRATDSSWLATASTSPAAFVRAHRLAPGQFYLGFPVNREGFVDVEPDEVLKKPHRVFCVGDSFSVAVVPHHWQYTTVAEGFFPDVEIYNAGVVNSGPREYVEVVRSSAKPLRPELVVVALFVGNDFTDSLRGNPTLATSLTDRNEVLVRQIVRRFLAYWEERRAGGMVSDPLGSTMTTGQTGGKALSPAEAERAMPWLADPLQETPSLSEERFGYVEAVRSEIVRPDAAPTVEAAFVYIEQIREAIRPVPLALLVFPDEFQVEDGLWSQVRTSRNLSDEDRDRPQRILTSWLDKEKIDFIDLLPRMRASPPLSDGKRHVYLLRDTHFNALGNKIAGAALAELIERAGIEKRSTPP